MDDAITSIASQLSAAELIVIHCKDEPRGGEAKQCFAFGSELEVGRMYRICMDQPYIYH